MNTARISIKEKFSYGLGDTGCNFSMANSDVVHGLVLY